MDGGDPRAAAYGPLDEYRLFRARIEHEDTLVIQRLSWLVASQSFLFTAYAITLNGLAAPSPVAALARHQELLLRLLPTVGVLTSGLIYGTILAAVRAIAGFRHAYHARVGPAAAALPPITTGGPTRLAGLSAPLLLPVVFVVVWLVLATR
ncbi:MAG TPA: hypothetical protein VFD84_20620 [Candidatus Binatia bacterium]|nr:hypothetical protein [Candidatus Binatia bacterium]